MREVITDRAEGRQEGRDQRAAARDEPASRGRVQTILDYCKVSSLATSSLGFEPLQKCMRHVVNLILGERGVMRWLLPDGPISNRTAA